MKQIIGASCIFLCDERFSILENGGLLIECDPRSQHNKILKIQDFKSLTQSYPELQASFYTDSVLLPALSNAHIHFEFSNNRSHLLYGDFPSWLSSVITHRDDLMTELSQSIQREIKLQLASGVASVGAISSYGYDISPLIHSPLKVTLFNEAIGSNPEALDFLYGNLLERFEECRQYSSARFKPALAIHSPYSTHYVLARKIAHLAKHEGVRLSCHFLESKEEKQWLYHQNGWFKEFFSHFFGVHQAKPSMNALEFLDLLQDTSPLFVHCLFADDEILDRIAKLCGFVACAPRSNRLLNGRYLDLDKLRYFDLHPIFSTDGLSSNHSLNLIEEIRSAFFGYASLDAMQLAQDLILGITRFPALALGNPNGEIGEGKDADLAIFECEGIESSRQKPLHFVLHAHTHVTQLYINGQGEQTWKL
ncbi:aminofutalosine deaminase family hydrolase [Helicobacter pametensis]|uniref:aminofutalosine deaminase family hydrolase n=1 Tax=Helicobacter pametensis TaxID=95149 RepID=UPI000480DA4D|nr:aminofutalosine deaminase family hydrolase [Helicobacter pametensis]